MFTISLHQIKIFAPIGLYPQEQLLGNHFEVDVDVDVDVDTFSEETFVDYSVLHDIVKDIFGKEEKLLESIAQKIHQDIKTRYAFVQKIKVSIRKMNPPLQGQINYSQVVYKQ